MKLPLSLVLSAAAAATLFGCFVSETVAPDASSNDAAIVGEGGADVDGSVPVDAAPPVDAGSSADADAGSSTDAGLSADANAITTVDASTALDAASEAADVLVVPPPVDPFPEAGAPGVYCCPGCPQPQLDPDAGFLLDPVSTPTVPLSGSVTGAVGDGVYYVVGPTGNTNRQLIPTDDVAGTYAVNGLVFCGEQTLKLVWSNAQGSCALVENVTRTSDDGGPCSAPDMQISLAWDSLGMDWELHLIRQGGQINVSPNDCTWTTCISSSPDWGVQGDPTDDPSKDVDNTSTYGPENIFLNRPEAITYTVMVEHWGNGQPGASGTVTINLAGQPAMVIAKNGLAPQHVWKAATIAYAAPGAPGVVTPYEDDIDCTASWSSGCTLPIP